MSASAAQLVFVAEFVVFLAAAAGVALVALRGGLVAERVRARLLLGGGCALLGTAAFLHGSQIERADGSAVLAVLRLGGVAALVAGTLGWQAGRSSRRPLLGGAAALAVAGLLAVAGVGFGPVEALMALGGVLLGAAVAAASRRSIAARVAASAAATLLLVVLVLAVALSAVLVRNVTDQAVSRLQQRAGAEARAAENEGRAPLADAKVTAASLAGDQAEPLTGRRAELSPFLNSLATTFFTRTELLFVAPPDPMAPSGKILGATVGLDALDAASISASPVVVESLKRAVPVTAVEVVGSRALAVATSPTTVAVVGSANRYVGVAVAVSALDRTYLEPRVDDPALSLALVTRQAPLASYGAQPRGPALGRLVRQVLDDGTGASATLGSRFVSVQPVRAGGQPILALVASTPTRAVSASRDDLFRTLFLIALGGTLLALVLAAVVGERIGAGIRRLTVAAEGVAAGDLTVRAGIETHDEVGALGAAFDSMATSIGDKTDAEARLRSRLEAVVAGMGEALVAVDADGRITDFNAAAEDLLGVTVQSARGAAVAEVVHLVDEVGSPLDERLERIAPGRWTTEAFVEANDGAHVPVGVVGGALRDAEGDVAGSVVVLRDLRREREVERMKTEFLSRVGHELRTPLTVIKGYADLLTRKEVAPERARSWHGEILKESDALIRIVQMLEFFATSGAGRVQLRPEAVEVRTLLDDAVARWRKRLDGSFALSRRVARGTPPVEVDRRWVGSALDELIDNAVKFSPTGSKISLTAALGAGGGIEVTVADRGKGMSHDELAVAFADFSQGDSSDTRSFGGLGLGLSLVQRVTEAHGGGVHVASVPGKGTKVSISLPGVPTKRR